MSAQGQPGVFPPLTERDGKFDGMDNVEDEQKYRARSLNNFLNLTILLYFLELRLPLVSNLK